MHLSVVNVVMCAAGAFEVDRFVPWPIRLAKFDLRQPCRPPGPTRAVYGSEATACHMRLGRVKRAELAGGGNGTGTSDGG